MLETQDVCRYQTIVDVPCTQPAALDAQERYGNRQDEHGVAMWARLGRAVTVRAYTKKQMVDEDDMNTGKIVHDEFAAC